MIKLKELREAKERLAVDSKPFPDYRGWDIGRIAISARLRVAGVDPSAAYIFAKELVEQDKDLLHVIHSLYDDYQFKILEAALMAGIAIGAQARKTNPRPHKSLRIR